METVGLSIIILGKGLGSSFDEIVSPIFIPLSPATATISPASTLLTETLLNPLNVYNAVNLLLGVMDSSPHKE